MKYLKLFKESQTSDLPYWEISVLQWRDSVYYDSLSSENHRLGEIEEFTPTEIQAIREILPNLEPKAGNLDPKLYGDFGFRSIQQDYSVYLYKLEDEYYIVQFRDRPHDILSKRQTTTFYFQCDQLDGLLQCLRSALLNK